MEKFRVTIGSVPDRENLVADIFYEGVQWAEISQETEKLLIQFYSHPREEYWEFPLDEALKVLEEAKKKFLNMGGYRT